MFYLGFNTLYEEYEYDERMESYAKVLKISGECIMLIVFEIWRLWLAFDGVLHSNSRTIWASASFTVFSFGFSILMIIESLKWIQVSQTFETDKLFPKELEPPFLHFISRHTAKDFGWDVYKKIGSSIKIQGMYITVQWFSLALKIDIYFEFCAYGLYVIALAFNFEDDPDFYFVFSIVLAMTILTIPSLVFSRCAISKESKTMMILFILYQATCIGFMGYIIVLIKEMLITWYAFTGFCLASIIATIGTIVMAITCLLNFDKGLKEFVQWKPFSKNMNQVDIFQRLEDPRVDEPIDDY
ncbi:hypothetical protein MFLAVUS_000114 [Mucor flavus]|uniref:Uncharacterized protein n=1 Tax=Mucor flavus TaxID=439312 RepID=A0ABP9YIS9_9FUNG